MASKDKVRKSPSKKSQNTDALNRINFLYQASLLFATKQNATTIKPLPVDPISILPNDIEMVHISSDTFEVNDPLLEDNRNKSSKKITNVMNLAQYDATLLMNSIPTNGPYNRLLADDSGQFNNEKRLEFSQYTPGSTPKIPTPPASLILPPYTSISRLYIHHLKQISQKLVLRLDPSVKRTICKCCCTFLIPGVSCNVGLIEEEGMMLLKCGTCGLEKRIGIKDEFNTGIEIK